MGFFDTHAHFHFPDFDMDREAVMERSRQAGLAGFVNVGTDLETSRASLELALKYPDIWASAGVHPHDAKDATESVFAEIETLLAHPRMVAIGEIGLDYYRDHSPRDKQKEVLNRFIEIYGRIQKPLILHCRDAYEDLHALLQSHPHSSYRGVMHCFSSGKEVMRQFVELGFYISFAGPLTYKKNEALREACAACPAERLLLETDAPFLPPQSKRGKRNESAFLIETAEKMAMIRQCSLQELSGVTTANAKRLFDL